MSRSIRRTRPRRLRTLSCRLEELESRMLLSLGGSGLDSLFHADPALDGSAVFDPGIVESPSTGPSASTLAAAYPLTSVPALSSLPGAAVSLYLDFDGDFRAQWGAYSNITTPAFDQDGDPTTLSDAELAAIRKTWEYVAEDYAPLQINVTTVEPASYSNGGAVHVVIGGNGTWTGRTCGGVAYVGSFTASSMSTVFVFPKNLGNGTPKYTADASSHEAGHAFGLEHQSLYDSNGVQTQEYYTGPGDGRAPLMGNSYYAARSLWWYGTSYTPTTYQDDLLRLSQKIGYRPDDYGNDAAHATSLAVSGNQVSSSGIIGTTADSDWFSFQTDAGQITLSVGVPAGINNLDARLELRDALGNLIASSDPSTGFGATITATVAAGPYRLVVASHGGYSDVGQYTVSGTILAPAGMVNAPTNLAATRLSSTQINLTWTDNAGNETGYAVYRSTDGQSWTAIAASLAANSTAYSDASVAAGTTYYYRVCAFNATTTSEFSNQAAVTVAPTAPGALSATAVSSSRIDLAWSDVGGETGYVVERSADQQTWSQIGTAAGNATSFQNTGLSSNTTYFYRVRASNAGGNSDPTGVALAKTLPAPVLPAAPSSLTARAVAPTQITLTWRDNSGNESGFIIERSTNGRSWTQVARTGANVATFTDTGLSARKTYQYRVRAFNEAGSTAPSNVAMATTPRAAPIVKAAAPSSLSAGAGSSSQITLTWRDRSGNESGFLIERSTNGRTWTEVARTGANVTSYTDGSLSAQTAYQYRVRAFNAAGASAASTVARATTHSAPQAATHPTQTPTTSARFDAALADVAWLASLRRRA